MNLQEYTRKYLKIYRLDRLLSHWLWFKIILISVLYSAFLIYMILFIPDCLLKRVFDAIPVGIHIGFVIVVAFAWSIVLVINAEKLKKLTDTMHDQIRKSDMSADEMMEYGKKNHIPNMLYVAVYKRLEELGIEEIPDCCLDEYEVIKLPTKEDIGK